MRRAILACLVAGLAAAAGATQLAGAGVVERVLVTDPARRAHGLPPGLVLELTSPPEYQRAAAGEMSGTWAGPAWVERSTGATGNASMDWDVTFDEREATELEQVVVRHVRHRDWARDQRGGLAIDRVVGKSVIGAIVGYYYVMVPGGSDARVEAVFAFPLEQRLYAVLHLEVTSPTRDTQLIGGMVGGTTWNRGQALIAMAATRLRGNLQPKVVGARVYENGRVVRGKVVDRFLDPVLGAPVALERGIGGTWRVVARGKTSQRGFYELRAGGRGAYRVTVNMAGFRAESRPFLAGRGRR